MSRKKGRFESRKSGKKTGCRMVFVLICMAVLATGVFLLNQKTVPEEIPAETAAVDPVVTVPNKTHEDHYAPVIEKYQRSAAEGWSKEQCEIEGISLRMEAGCDWSKAGYAYLDLDSDGREELIIAEESTSLTDNIWDIYTTLEDGTPIQLWVDERDGGQCKLYEGNIISVSYSYNDELDLTFYDLKAGQLVMRESLQYEDEDTVVHVDTAGKERPVTASEAMDISYAYKPQKIVLNWLIDMPDEIRGADSQERYMLVLERYKTALTEKWDMGQCSDNDISLMISHFGDQPDLLCAAYVDLDENGIPELMITDGMMLYDLYTLKNGEPVKLLTGWERNSYRFCVDNVISNHASSSAFQTSFRFYRLESGDLVLTDAVVFDASVDPDHPWFCSDDGETPGAPLTEQEANAILDSYENISVSGTPILK